MKLFLYDKVNSKVVLNKEECLIIKEFKELLDPARNKTSSDKTGKKLERAFKEFTYMYLFFDWESPYFQYVEQERHEEAFRDAELTQEEWDDPIFRNACKKYDALQNSSKIGKLLKASYLTIDKITNYLETLDLSERDPATGKPIFKTKDIIAEISSASKLYDAVKALEISFKKEVEPENALRGDVNPGLFD